MTPDSISRMAKWAAYFRAFHAEHASPKIFDDFLAAPIVDGLLAEKLAQTRELARLLLATAAERASLAPEMQQALSALDRMGPAHLRPFADEAAAFSWIMQVMVPSSLVLSRARYAEDLLENAIRRGTRQYVILGAGLDTFAFRRMDILDRVRVFEVDHPVTQAGKRRRLSELGWATPEGLHFVPVDLTRERLAAALARTPFDPALPTFFGWLGVTYYLAHDDLVETLESIARIATRSELVFDYFDVDAFVPEKRALRVQFSFAEGERVGEPLRSGLDPATLAAVLARVGMDLREDLGPAEIQQRYFRDRADGYTAFEQAHLAYAAAAR